MTEQEKYKLTLFTLIKNNLMGHVPNYKLNVASYQTMKSMIAMIDFEKAKNNYEEGEKTNE